jgi:hypothetical protein
MRIALPFAIVLAACGGDHVEPNQPTQTSEPSANLTPPPSATETAAPPPQPSSSAAASAPPTTSGSAGPLLGGYMQKDVADKEIVAEAAQAITLLQADRKDPKIALTSIKSAATQVVAGLNYKLELQIKTGSGDKTVTVVMYKDLSGKRKLSDVKGF